MTHVHLSPALPGYIYFLCEMQMHAARQQGVSPEALGQQTRKFGLVKGGKWF